MKNAPRQQAPTADIRMLRLMAEDLKLPLIQIARQAELFKLSKKSDLIESIELSADNSLRLLDSYILSMQLAHNQIALELEPVAVSAVLYDSAQRLHKLAELYGCDVSIEVASNSSLVMADRRVLEAGLTSLGHAFISSVPVQENKRTQLKLVSRRTKQGVTAGVFSNVPDLTNGVLKQAKQLVGQARQPLEQISRGAGIFIADSLFEQTSGTPLRVANFRRNTGLSTTLVPSHQLILV